MDSSTTLSIQNKPYEPFFSKRTYAALAVVSAIVLIVSAIFMDYIVKNYVDSRGYLTNNAAGGLFALCEIGMLAPSLAFVGFIIDFFTNKADPTPPVIHSEQEEVR